MWMLKERYFEGVKTPASSFSLSRMAFVHKMMFLFRRDQLRHEPPDPAMRGSPPGMDTMGAPHSSEVALRHWSTVRFFRRI